MNRTRSTRAIGTVVIGVALLVAALFVVTRILGPSSGGEAGQACRDLVSQRFAGGPSVQFPSGSPTNAAADADGRWLVTGIVEIGPSASTRQPFRYTCHLAPDGGGHLAGTVDVDMP